MANNLPIFPYWDKVPEDFGTKTQLKDAGLMPGGPVRALIRYNAHGKVRQYNLYKKAEAIPRPTPTEAQMTALAAAHRDRRTCTGCGIQVERPRHLDHRRRCRECVAADARLQRASEYDETILWARDLLLQDDWLVLDTETTDLAEYGGVMVEIAIVAPDGHVVLQSLVNPEAEISPEAEAVHDITPEQLIDAPPFSALEPKLRSILHGKRLIVYNADFDKTIFLNDLRRLFFSMADKRSPRRRAKEWVGESTWQCAMEQYACYVGEWYDEYSYRYQRLPGAGHRAAGDCLAVLRLIQRMAATRLSWDVPPVQEPSLP